MRYYIISGEASGDLHGSNLLRALLHRDTDAEIRYWGGDRMAEVAAGCREGQVVQVRHIRELAYMGFVEVVGHLGTVMGNIRFCKADIMQFRPDVMVFIDYPGFNLKIAEFTHKQGFRNVYYISPQIWAWKKGRLKSMRRDLDRLCYILPSERTFYAENAMAQALYVGHPLLDEVGRYLKAKASPDKISVVEDLQCDTSCPTTHVALLPGSRKHELRRMLPLMAALARRHREIHFDVAGMRLIGEAYYRRYLPKDLTNVTLWLDSTYDILGQSRAAVVCSGTATLETALFGVPQVVCYEANKLSAAIIRMLINRKLKYISLVNLIAEAPVVTELIQGDFNLSRVEHELLSVINNGPRRDAILEGYAKVRELLGGEGASDRVAEEIIKFRV